MAKDIKKIGVLTSGGDAPGMNAAIRAVVRASIYYGKEPVGIYRGFEGLIEGDFVDLNARSVSSIIQRGGTILKSARSQKFMTEEGRKKAHRNIQSYGMDALVTIGGDGTFKGSSIFNREFDMPVMSIPGTIDNDITGTDFTIGYDTACNRVIDAIDAIRDTASSHNRLFFIEVMGRHTGFIALRTAIAAGVEAFIIPEKEMTIDQLMAMIETGAKKKKSSTLVVVAEGSKIGSATQIAEKVNEKFPHYDTKVTVLGHLQRGGVPSCLDREIASRMGVAAVEGLLEGKMGVMVGIVHNEVVFTPFEEVIGFAKAVNMDLFRINEILTV